MESADTTVVSRVQALETRVGVEGVRLVSDAVSVHVARTVVDEAHEVARTTDGRCRDGSSKMGVDEVDWLISSSAPPFGNLDLWVLAVAHAVQKNGSNETCTPEICLFLAASFTAGACRCPKRACQSALELEGRRSA